MQRREEAQHPQSGAAGPGGEEQPQPAYGEADMQQEGEEAPGDRRGAGIVIVGEEPDGRETTAAATGDAAAGDMGETPEAAAGRQPGTTGGVPKGAEDASTSTYMTKEINAARRAYAQESQQALRQFHELRLDGEMGPDVAAKFDEWVEKAHAWTELVVMTEMPRPGYWERGGTYDAASNAAPLNSRGGSLFDEFIRSLLRTKIVGAEKAVIKMEFEQGKTPKQVLRRLYETFGTLQDDGESAENELKRLAAKDHPTLQSLVAKWQMLVSTYARAAPIAMSDQAAVRHLQRAFRPDRDTPSQYSHIWDTFKNPTTTWTSETIARYLLQTARHLGRLGGDATQERPMRFAAPAAPAPGDDADRGRRDEGDERTGRGADADPARGRGRRQGKGSRGGRGGRGSGRGGGGRGDDRPKRVIQCYVCGENHTAASCPKRFGQAQAAPARPLDAQAADDAWNTPQGEATPDTMGQNNGASEVEGYWRCGAATPMTAPVIVLPPVTATGQSIRFTVDGGEPTGEGAEAQAGQRKAHQGPRHSSDLRADAEPWEPGPAADAVEPTLVDPVLQDVGPEAQDADDDAPGQPHGDTWVEARPEDGPHRPGEHQRSETRRRRTHTGSPREGDASSAYRAIERTEAKKRTLRGSAEPRSRGAAAWANKDGWRERDARLRSTRLERWRLQPESSGTVPTWARGVLHTAGRRQASPRRETRPGPRAMGHLVGLMVAAAALDRDGDRTAQTRNRGDQNRKDGTRPHDARSAQPWPARPAGAVRVLIDTGSSCHNTCTAIVGAETRMPHGGYDEPRGLIDGGDHPHRNRGVQAATFRDAHTGTTFTVRSDNDCEGWRVPVLSYGALAKDGFTLDLCAESAADPPTIVAMDCNLQWPEFKRELRPGEAAADRPDLIARVFQTRVDALLREVLGIFGPVLACRPRARAVPFDCAIHYEELRKRVGGVAPDELAECVTGVLGGEYRKVLWDSNGALRYDVDKVRRILNEIPPPPEEDLEGQFRDEVKAAHECLMEHAHFYRPA